MSCSSCLESSSYDLENPIISIQCGHQAHKHCLPNNFLERKENNCPKCRNKKKMALSEPRTNKQLSQYSNDSPTVRYKKRVEFRAIGRSENPGVPVLLGGHNLPPFVEIGLTDLPKSESAPPGTTGLEVSLAWRTIFWIFGAIFVFLTIIFAILDFLEDFSKKRPNSLKSEEFKLENKVNKKRTLG
jgi:hypothetical protein